MDLAVFNEGLLHFLQQSTTPFHAVKTLKSLLDDAGFTELDERDAWSIQPDHHYYVIRNGSSIVAFKSGRRSPLETGIRLVGAHTDSPCLRVKPNPELHQKGYFQVGVEVYGGVLLNPWFDRDLSLAGRVTYQDADGQVGHALIDFRRPLAMVPSLAIHLDREANNSRSINSQRDLPPLIALESEGMQIQFREILKGQLQAEHPSLSPKAILDYELSFYDCQPAAMLGLNQEFIASARLDNLLSCYIGVRAMLDADGEQPALLVCNDHEEVGSMTAEGAQGPFLSSVLERWLGREDLSRVMARSMMVSADNAHAVHPNFADRHDGNHGPVLNQGPVIKINNNQRYATNSLTSSLYRQLSDELKLPYQTFVVRTDMACGSTIGPLTAANLGVKTLDIGVPQLAMHSIRELAGGNDGHTLYQVLRHFMMHVQLP
ncbi:M18 family aminopeptidase [Mangrovitalea sediminis]|uniref:M18 family aminopeptidase n=1 Tax=Mangrovitalea sediminis TaxID=1982043 RepID=UPI000BE53EDE|nr:M18 family aminopeptidase [Mangrovitalea sediminis]